MNSHNNFHSKNIIHQPLKLPHLPSPFKRILEILTHYDTPKVIRIESKWIATLSLLVKLTFGIVCLYLMYQPNSYQIYDRSPISAVIISVEPSPNCSRNASIMRYFKDYNCAQSLYDVNDFILPAIENSAVSIITHTTENEHVLKYCGNKTNPTAIHTCSNLPQCILPPFYRNQHKSDKIVQKSQLCWFKLPYERDEINYQALDYILYIEHVVEFPLFKLRRNNLMVNKTDKNYTKYCEYDNKTDLLCPRFRVLKLLQMIENNTEEYEPMFRNGSLIEIKITWNCNLDRKLEHCKPVYSFKRLDYTPYRAHPYSAGSTFHTSRHFFRPNSPQLHRIHTTIYNLHIIVSVTGEMGQLDYFQASTSIGSFIGILAIGQIVCDLIAGFITNFKRVKYDS